MLQRPRLRATAVVTLLALVVSCVPTRLPPISGAGDSFQPLRDERRLWQRSREEEKKLRDNVEIYPDPLLVGYLEEVVSRLNPEGMAANPAIGFRVGVIEDPTLNAFAYPHGSIYLHTGLLARMENEDQLATVLGHEMTHVEHRHMLRYQRSVRNKQIGFAIGAVAAAVIIAGEQGEAVREGKYGKAARIGVLRDVLVGLGLTLALIAAVHGYGRDLEREADQGAFDKLAAAGYDAREAPAVYRALLEDRGESRKLEVFFFGSHPQLASRIEGAERWLADHPDRAAPLTDRGTESQERFLRRMRPVIRDDARLNMELGRLTLAERQLERARGLMPEDPEVHLLLGELRLQRADAEKDPAAKRRLRDEARDAFREAIRLDPERPAAHRELGLVAYRDGDFETACVAFRHFVELDPRAEEAGRVRDYLLELERDGRCP